MHYTLILHVGQLFNLILLIRRFGNQCRRRPLPATAPQFVLDPDLDLRIVHPIEGLGWDILGSFLALGFLAGQPTHTLPGRYWIPQPFMSAHGAHFTASLHL
ncbi:hypothetical protein H4Q26_005441 [Puccinia striiformis f. sp. tritici PST-130]|nr:hypothetical protein H4Q26_005441 [Puccinia striiformis f. sp. tritici PST-130]